MNTSGCLVEYKHFIKMITGLSEMNVDQSQNFGRK